jgi:glycerate kinase
MRVLFAPDKFKGSLTALEAAAAMARGWLLAWPEAEILAHPVADGGDGSLEVLRAALGGEWKRCTARDARGRPREVQWLWQPDTRTAWIETARVAGLAELPDEERDPLSATSAGVGDVLRTALREGAQQVFVCLGGVATNDAGCGMAEALGWRFFDDNGRTINPLLLHLSQAARIQSVSLGANIIGLTDVTNPLLGSEGASRIFGPQKGATPEDVARLEEILRHVANVAQRDLGAPDPMIPGAGAAGGLGYGVIAFTGGKLANGFDAIAECTDLSSAIRDSDLVVTGEGQLDEQTAAGKAPAGVARLAREQGKPVIALVGSFRRDSATSELFDAVMSIQDKPRDLAEAMRNAALLLEKTTSAAARLIRVGARLQGQ